MLAWSALTAALLSSLSLSALAKDFILSSRASVCNGHAELCQRSFGNITFVGAHDSYAVGTNNLAVNQDYNITQQLDSGVRMLQMQAHNNNGVIELCHTNCGLFDGGTLNAYLKTVVAWLQANPTEVVSLLIVNIDNLPAAQYATVFEAVQADRMSYVPTSGTLQASEWPTLGSLIDNNTRLVTFIDNQADFQNVPYIIDEFTNIWESAYDIVDPSLFNCQVNRSKGDTSTSMFLINHFLDKELLGVPTPDINQANVTNAASGAGSLGEEVATCVALHGRNPNFMLVDFYEYGGGSVFQVAAAANGVQYTGTVPLPATAAPSNTGGSSHSNSAPRDSMSGLIPISLGMVLGFAAVFA